MVQDRCHLTPVDYAQINGQDLCFNYLNEVIGEWVGLVGEWERENGMLAFKRERKREGVGANIGRSREKSLSPFHSLSVKLLLCITNSLSLFHILSLSISHYLHSSHTRRTHTHTHTCIYTCIAQRQAEERTGVEDVLIRKFQIYCSPLLSTLSAHTLSIAPLS